MSEGGGVPRSLWHPRPVKELKDGVAVVTGAAGGIGAAVARKLTEEGMQVILVDRDGVALASLAATRDLHHREGEVAPPPRVTE